MEAREANDMRLLICSILVVSAIGCGATHVVPVSNVERATTVWESDEGLIPHLCLEYSSPAEKLDATKASLGVPIGTKSVEVSYESAQSLATIYTVSEIMQFGHAALYRLCEAVGNGALDKEKFGELFDKTLNNMNNLIRLQLEAKDSAGVSAAVGIQQDVRELDKRRCQLLEKSATTGFEAEWQTLMQERGALEKRYKGIQATQHVLQDLPADTVGPLRDSVTTYLSRKKDKRGDLPQGAGALKAICGLDLATAL
jgi:hypothetical protein